MLASSDKASTDVSANVKRKLDFVGLSVCVCGARSVARFDCAVSVLQE